MATVAELSELMGDTTAVVAGVEVDAMSGAQAEALVAAAVRLAHAAEHLAARAARRVGATGVHRRCGDRSEAHHLARVGGVGVGAARRGIDTARLLGSLPATAAAAASGELSGRQAAAIAAAATADPAVESRLLSMARSRALSDLEEECARVIAAACPDDTAERHRRARAARSARQTRLADGSAQITYRSSLDEVAEVWAIVRRYADALFEQARRDGVRDSHDNYLADGLLAMARTAGRAGTHPGPAGAPLPHADPGGAATTAPPDQPGLFDPASPAPARRAEHKVIVRIDWDALVRGHTIAGETSDIAGIGPVPVAVVRDLIATGDPFLAAVVTRGVDVATVAHLGRRPTAHQRTALEWTQPRCRAAGCGRTVGLEIDHTLPWADTKITLLAHLDWLCTHHHDLKSHHGWALTPGTGTRPLVPPDDPRHPTRAGPPAA